MNNNEDRGMMKWAPFHSVLSEEEVNQYINTNIINEKPLFSEEQIEKLESLIKEAYASGQTITLTIYGKIKNTFVTGIITKLDGISKCVYVDKKPYRFSEILDIKYE